MLVDRFQEKNTYVIAKRDDDLIGMVCFNLEKPFSLDGKVTTVVPSLVYRA